MSVRELQARVAATRVDVPRRVRQQRDERYHSLRRWRRHRLLPVSRAGSILRSMDIRSRVLCSMLELRLGAVKHAAAEIQPETPSAWTRVPLEARTSGVPLRVRSECAAAARLRRENGATAAFLTRQKLLPATQKAWVALTRGIAGYLQLLAGEETFLKAEGAGAEGLLTRERHDALGARYTMRTGSRCLLRVGVHMSTRSKKGPW